MKNKIVSIISEGIEDQGVLVTILKAYGFESNEVKFIRPELSKDATDIHDHSQTIGTFQGVKRACEGFDGKRPDFEKALLFKDCNSIIVHIDTAEIEEQGFIFKKPNKTKNENYSIELRKLVIKQINNWLDNNYKENLLYAIAIEEIEAWCLTAIEKKDTVLSANPKKKLKKYLKENKLTYSKFKLDPIKDKREYYKKITTKLKFNKKVKLKKYAEYNQSLKCFIESLEVHLNKNG